MSSYAALLQIAAVCAAVLWPLGAGLALVFWTRSRTAERRRRMAAIDAGLTGIFRAVQAEPVPGRLELVVEALEEQAAVGERAKAGPNGRKVAPTR
jgi:hypothetical protein